MNCQFREITGFISHGFSHGITTADTYTKGGKKIEPVTSTYRLFLGANFDSRFSLGATLTTSPSSDPDQVALTVTPYIGGKAATSTFLISIQEVAQRLHLTKAEAKRQTLDGKIESRDLETVALVVSAFEEIITRHTGLDDGSRKTVMSLVRSFYFKTDQKNVTYVGQDPNSGAVFLRINEPAKHVIGIKDRAGSLYLFENSFQSENLVQSGASVNSLSHPP